VPKPEGIHLFEGWPDLLTVLTREKTDRLLYDAISLNSVLMLESVLPFVKGYGYQKLFSWMDNDAAGNAANEKLKAFVQAEEGLTHYCMNKIYTPHKDVNAWHMADLGLPQFQP
jgi:hypothetical protein